MNDEYIVNLSDSPKLRAFSYIGGKSRYIDWLYSHFPTNFSSFYDVCGGSGTVTYSMNVPAFCNKVVLNDYDKKIYKFHATLKGDRGDELEDRLLRFDYDNFDKLHWAGINSTLDYFETMDCVEAAVNTYLQIVYSFSNTRNGYVQKKKGYLKSVTRKNIPLIRNRLRDIEVTHRDFIDILKEVKSEYAFVYIDVPYRLDTRCDGLYKLEMEESQHNEMLNILQNAPYRWALSGYREENLFKPDKYDTRLSEFSAYTKVLSTYKYSGISKKKNNLFRTPADDLIDKFMEEKDREMGKTTAVDGKTPVKEILWRNYEVLGEPEI